MNMGVGGQRVLAGDLLGAGLEALADVDEVLPDVLGLGDELIELGEATATAEEAQAEAIGEVVAALAPGCTMGCSHLDAVLGTDDLTDRTFGLGHGVDADALLLELLAGLEHLGGGAGLGGGQDDGAVGHVLVAEYVPLRGVDEMDLEVLVAELIHKVLELHELVPGAADAHQEHGVVALIGDAVGQGGHLLARLHEAGAPGEIGILVEMHDLHGLGLLHLFPLSLA